MQRTWPLSVAFWAPSPHRVLVVDRTRLNDSLRAAALYREQVLEGAADRLKRGLLRLELDALGDEKVKETATLLQNLEQLRGAISELTARPGIQGAGRVSPPDPPEDRADPSPNHPRSGQVASYTISVVPHDPTFTVSEDLRRELLAKIYTPQHNWLPQFGRWYTTLTSAAMQRRVFPKELRGTGNFQNSTSQKLMRAVTDVILTATGDFYNDERHIPDTLSGLCLLNAYYYARRGGRGDLPSNLPELWADLGPKLKVLATDVRQGVGGKRTFTFLQTPSKQAETIAPLNKQNKYAPTFFTQHALFQLLRDAGLFPHIKDGDPRDSLEEEIKSGSDLTLAITSSLFGDRVPPFISYQWNLRTGLIALEVFLLTFILLENVQVTKGGAAQNRLQFQTLLGEEWTTAGTVQFHKKGTVFDFLIENYVAPTLSNNPGTPVSTLFPGVILLAFEAHAHNSSSAQPIQLTTKKFNDIFEIINQRYTFRDASPLLRAHASLRISIEEGLSALLSSLSGGNFTQEILKTQFGMKTDYDLLYFLVLGFLPAAVALV